MVESSAAFGREQQQQLEQNSFKSGKKSVFFP
jgi:hypothetical protein